VFLAGSFIMILSSVTVLGSLLSDILLVAIDPRIRFGGAD
jgi:peptide/nickel transport system permease protein